jgi:hypothetical protein
MSACHSIAPDAYDRKGIGSQAGRAPVEAEGQVEYRAPDPA